MKITVEQYQEAISKSLSAKQIELLQTLLHFPNSTATAKELAETLNYKNHNAAQFQIGKIGKAIANYLNIIPETYYDGHRESPAYFLIVGPYFTRERTKKGKKYGWEMVDNLRTALINLKTTSPNKAFLFTFNSDLNNWNEIEESFEDFNSYGNCILSWRCKSNSVKEGDSAYLIKIGKNPKGIIGSGIVTTIPIGYRDEKDRIKYFINIQMSTLIDWRKNNILTIDDLKTNKQLAKQNWTPQASGISIKPELVEELERVWFHFLSTSEIKSNIFLPSDSENERIFIEGNANQVILTKYERDPFARKICIKYYGLSCSVCNFNFENTFGQLGKDFIHVHHLTQLSTTGKNQETNPIKDLRPVCPNCHAMLHRKNPALTIDELKSVLKNDTTTAGIL